MNEYSPIKPWKNYENKIYELFCSTGHHCEKDVVIQGVRGAHQIDVLVHLNIAPPGHRWLVECKHRSRPIAKHEVEAFKTVIDDIGADHGYLLSEQGFQKGAITMASTFNISLCSLIQLQDQFVREQIMPGYRESQAFCVSCKEVEDSGMMDSEAIVELRSTGKLSVIDNIIEIHIIRIHHGLFHEVISRGACRNYLNEEGALRISLPCDIPHLEAQSIPLDGGGYHFTDKTAEGMEISGPYRVVFRTLAGPVSVNAYVPTYK